MSRYALLAQLDIPENCFDIFQIHIIFFDSLLSSDNRPTPRIISIDGVYFHSFPPTLILNSI